MSSQTVDVAAEVRAALGRRRLNQASLAAKIGMNPSTLSRRLSGEIEFSVSQLTDVAAALEVPLSELLPALAESEARS